MKVLLCHNVYQQPGGEDQSFEAENWLLESHGHQTIRFIAHNHSINRMSRLAVAGRTVWNPQTYRELRELIRRERPELMHCTNTFPLISPAAYYAARAEGVPVVQSLRNYRLLCPSANFLRNGRVCEDCLGRLFAWPAVFHGCYRDSRAASAVVAVMVSVHRMLKTWKRTIQTYFTPTEFSRRKFVEAGLPAEQIAVKPNFVHPDPGLGNGTEGYVVFVGRLSPEKGIGVLLRAWQPAMPRLKIIGDGPLAGEVQEAAGRNPAIEWLGRRSPAEVLSILGEALCLVTPSVCYETFGRTIVEAFARGTPVIASRLGAMAELVEDRRTGLLFEPGSADDLADKVFRLAGDAGLRSNLRTAAREEYVSRYTAERNYGMLMEIYARAMRTV